VDVIGMRSIVRRLAGLIDLDDQLRPQAGTDRGARGGVCPEAPRAQARTPPYHSRWP
jgi:hypothetical protein